MMDVRYIFDVISISHDITSDDHCIFAVIPTSHDITSDVRFLLFLFLNVISL